MSSTLIAARVDSDIARRTRFFIDRSGVTQADVIRRVWQQISETGVVPTKNESANSTQESLKNELRALTQIAPKTDFLKNLSPQDLKRELESRA